MSHYVIRSKCHVMMSIMSCHVPGCHHRWRRGRSTCCLWGTPPWCRSRSQALSPATSLSWSSTSTTKPSNIVYMFALIKINNITSPTSTCISRKFLGILTDYSAETCNFRNRCSSSSSLLSNKSFFKPVVGWLIHLKSIAGGMVSSQFWMVLRFFSRNLYLLILHWLYLNAVCIVVVLKQQQWWVLLFGLVPPSPLCPRAGGGECRRHQPRLSGRH